MPDRTFIRVPKYRLHKPTGLAVVHLSGRDVYLGSYGSPESEARYENAVAEWLKNDRKPPPRPSRGVPRDKLVVDELILTYLEFAKGYYVKSGRQTGEVRNIEDALRFASLLCGSMPVAEFGPVALKVAREAMVRGGLWGPNRLRHNAATFLRKEFGLDAARVVLGHTSAAVTEICAEMDRKKAAEITGVVG